MEKTVFSLVSLVAGTLMIIFYKLLGRFILEQQNKFWGFNLGKKSLIISQVFSVVAGIGFVVFGVLSLLKIIQFRH